MLQPAKIIGTGLATYILKKKRLGRSSKAALLDSHPRGNLYCKPRRLRHIYLPVWKQVAKHSEVILILNVNIY